MAAVALQDGVAEPDQVQRVTEWIENSYTLVAPKMLARQVHPQRD